MTRCINQMSVDTIIIFRNGLCIWHRDLPKICEGGRQLWCRTCEIVECQWLLSQEMSTKNSVTDHMAATSRAIPCIRRIQHSNDDFEREENADSRQCYHLISSSLLTVYLIIIRPYPCITEKRNLSSCAHFVHSETIHILLFNYFSIDTILTITWSAVCSLTTFRYTFVKLPSRTLCKSELGPVHRKDDAVN